LRSKYILAGELKSFNVAAGAGEGLDAVVNDNVNVISFSIDTCDDVQFNYDFIDIATYKAMERDIFVSAAAGNAAPAISSVGNGASWMLTVAVGTTVKLGNSLTGRSSMRSHCSSHGRAPSGTSSHSRSWRRRRPGRPWLQLPLRQRYALYQIACKGQEATEVRAGSTSVRGKAAARGQHLCCCPTGDGEGASSLNRMPKRTLNTSHH
jgi:hypothetical protein